MVEVPLKDFNELIIYQELICFILWFKINKNIVKKADKHMQTSFTQNI